MHSIGRMQNWARSRIARGLRRMADRICGVSPTCLHSGPLESQGERIERALREAGIAFSLFAPYRSVVAIQLVGGGLRVEGRHYWPSAADAIGDLAAELAQEPSTPAAPPVRRHSPSANAAQAAQAGTHSNVAQVHPIARRSKRAGPKPPKGKGA